MHGDIQCIRILLRDGHGSPYDTDGINTPLILAVQGEHVEICEVLLHAGADPYEETSLQRSAYDYAWDMILGNQVDERNIRGLQKLFSDTDALENRQFTLLHKVVLGLNPVDLSTIVQNMSRSRVNEGDAYGQTALCWAAMRQDVEHTKLLLENGANPNVTPEKGHTALQSAAQSGCYTCIELLLRAGAEVNYQGAAQMTALHIAAAKHDNVGIIRLLLQHGADINLKARLRVSALWFACTHGHLHTTKYLVEHGADVHQLYPSGEGVFHAACWGNNPEIVRFFLKNVNYCHTTRLFGTPLHGAARFLSIEIVKVLTEARLEGIDTEERFKGYTALEHAQRRKNVPPEWLEAFMDLLRSVNPNTELAETSSFPQGEQSKGGFEETEATGNSETEVDSDYFFDAV
ncbi:MAG: hypothetical protein M1830_004341 [Pleopsidium flavum]|nr:MAG: hypothetical protein M1830_004341 [Pleopsidium flavum]